MNSLLAFVFLTIRKREALPNHWGAQLGFLHFALTTWSPARFEIPNAEIGDSDWSNPEFWSREFIE